MTIELNQRGRQLWVETNPYEAFEKVLDWSNNAKALLLKEHYTQAIPYLTAAYETSALIFKLGINSPQLTTMYTANAVVLAQTYRQTGEWFNSYELLQNTHNILQAAIVSSAAFSTKGAFFKHCLNMVLEALSECDVHQHIVPQPSNANRNDLHLH